MFPSIRFLLAADYSFFIQTHQAAEVYKNQETLGGVAILHTTFIVDVLLPQRQHAQAARGLSGDITCDSADLLQYHR